MAEDVPTQEPSLDVVDVNLSDLVGDLTTEEAYEAQLKDTQAHLDTISQRLADSGSLRKYFTTPNTLGRKELELARKETTKELNRLRDELQRKLESDRDILTQPAVLEHSTGKNIDNLNAQLEAFLDKKTGTLRHIIREADMSGGNEEAFAHRMSGEPEDERVAQSDIDLARGVHGLAGGETMEDVDRAVRAGSDEGPRK